MSQNIKIKGTVCVIVDAVDIDQTEIESPAILRESMSVKAMVAARANSNFISMRRVCERNNHTLEYDDFKQLSLGRVEVSFTVRAKSADELKD